MRYIIITGANRGLGEALVNYFKSDHVIGIIRTTTDNEHINKQYTCELSNEVSVQNVIESLNRDYSFKEEDEVVLINNAGTVKPVKRAENACVEGYLNSYMVNVLAPIILTNGLINSLKDVNCSKKVVNISSGAAINPVSGWSAYCSAKAGLNMFTEVVKLEQESVENGVKVVTFRPGVIDTDMQVEIRNSNEKEFEDVERFKGLKDNNQLLSADVVASALGKLIVSKDFGEETHTSVQDYL